MAGGSGTRLWPLSRSGRPKQLLDIVAGGDGPPHSLLAEAFTRLETVLPADRIWVCTAARYGEQVRAALPRLRPDRLVLEPVARDTANAVGLAAALVADVDPDAELAVVRADRGARRRRGGVVPREARPRHRRGLPGLGGVPLELGHVRVAGGHGPAGA